MSIVDFFINIYCFILFLNDCFFLGSSECHEMKNKNSYSVLCTVFLSALHRAINTDVH